MKNLRKIMLVMVALLLLMSFVACSEDIANYTVIHDSQGADTEASPISLNIVAGNTVGSLPTAPQRTGYIFSGWFIAINGGGTEFTSSTAVGCKL